MKIKDIPKFVINLDRRPDRLQQFDKEMKYLDWSYERFSAIDTNSYVGCGASHKKLAEIILRKKYDYAIVMEDDLYCMPYIKEKLPDLENQLFNQNISWNIVNFAPAIHKPLNLYNQYLLDLTNTPLKNSEIHRGIYCTTSLLLTPLACEYILEWDSNKYIENSNMQKAIDQYFDEVIYPRIPSLAPSLPLFVQRKGFSDINQTHDNNHYIITYNWNSYCPTKIDTKMFDQEYCDALKNEN